MSRKPLIGVVPLWDDDKESLWILPGYFDGIQQAGGLPLMLPLTDDHHETAQLASLCDGFLFTGGHDVSPAVYGEKPLNDSVICCPKRDRMESLLLQEAKERQRIPAAAAVSMIFFKDRSSLLIRNCFKTPAGLYRHFRKHRAYFSILWSICTFQRTLSIRSN